MYFALYIPFYVAGITFAIYSSGIYILTGNLRSLSCHVSDPLAEMLSYTIIGQLIIFICNMLLPCPWTTCILLWILCPGYLFYMFVLAMSGP